MLKTLTRNNARRIARLAKTARDAREGLLHGVADESVNEPHPAKGEQDRIGTGAFDVLPADHVALSALRRAIGELNPAARSELFALMRIGQGELAPGDWERGLSEAASLGGDGVSGVLVDDIDLSTHVDKGLYELGAA